MEITKALLTIVLLICALKNIDGSALERSERTADVRDPPALPTHRYCKLTSAGEYEIDCTELNKSQKRYCYLKRKYRCPMKKN